MDNKWECLSPPMRTARKFGLKTEHLPEMCGTASTGNQPLSQALSLFCSCCFAIAGPMFTKYSYSTQNLEVVNIPPYMKVFETPDNSGYLYITQALKVLR